MTAADRPMPRRFRIWVDGRLSPGFAAGLDGVAQDDTDDGTVLFGWYVDESHLDGVLAHLRRLAISVQRFEIDPAPGVAQTVADV